MINPPLESCRLFRVTPLDIEIRHPDELGEPESWDDLEEKRVIPNLEWRKM